MRWVGDRIGKEERTDISIKRLPCRRRQQPNLPVTGYLGMLLILHERKKKKEEEKKRSSTLSHPSRTIIPRGIFEMGNISSRIEIVFLFILFYSREARYEGSLKYRANIGFLLPDFERRQACALSTVKLSMFS